MTIAELGARPRKSAAQPSSLPDDHQVLTFKQWCETNNFSETTGWRILRGPKAKRPKVMQLSARRIGIRKGDNRRWQESRVR
jgi:hypothetical protein